MHVLTTVRSALITLAAFALLAGCGSGSTPSVPAAFAAPPNGEKSWMVPESKRTALLYISNSGTSSVTVYTYVDGSGLLLVGTLTGFSIPTGMCTDNAGNVWIPDYGSGKIYEYAHGGTTPIFTIKQHTGLPFDCAIDTKTGNLAVANQHPNGHFQTYSTVEVYPKGSREGRNYQPATGFSQVFFVAYDNMSNIFADGTPCLPSGCGSGGFSGGPPALFELSKGATQFTPLTLSGATLNQPSAVNWVKPILLLGDQDFQGSGTNGAYKLFVSGSTATVVGTLPFQGTQQTYGFWRRASRVIVPDHTGNIVRIYNLSNGSLTNTLKTEISLPFGAVVSQ